MKINHTDITNKILEILNKKIKGNNKDLSLSFEEIVEFKNYIKNSNINTTIDVVNSKGEKLYELALLTNIELHDITNEYPKMNQSEFETLKYSISKNWQIEPVLVYRGKIVDGRHRYLALKELGIPVIKIEKLPNNLTLDEVKEIVDAKNSQRRHMTKSQLSVKAYREWKEKGNITKADVAMKYGIARTALSHCEKIEKYLGSEVLNIMFEKGKWTDGSGKTHNSLTSIVNYIRKLNENNKEKNNENKIISEDIKDVVNKINILKNEGSIEKISIILSEAKKALKQLIEE